MNFKFDAVWLKCLTTLVACTGLLVGVCASAQDPPAPPDPLLPAADVSSGSILLPEADANGIAGEEDEEAMLRGPVHEAFAEQVNADPGPPIMITAQPPEPIEELPPDVRPEGRDIEWISGYWSWDDDANDFLWVSGIWREVPQGFRWLPGYWSEVEGGYQWVSGTWVSTQTAEIEYLETAPPESLENGPVGTAPTVQHIWIPGCWTWVDTRYAWRPGYWSGGYDNWCWIPARYQWTPRGYYYCNGYWDYPLERRGVLFAPYRFRRGFYGRRGFQFTPRIVVASHLLPLHFWVRPRYRHYYFGDYYGVPFANRGMMPWHRYHRSNRGFDPLFAYYGRSAGLGVYFNRLDTQFNLFVSNPDRRPMRSFRDMDRFLGNRRNNNDFVFNDRNNDRFLGARLQQVVERSSSSRDGMRFVRLDSDRRERFRESAGQIRNLVSERRDVERVIAGRDREVGDRLNGGRIDRDNLRSNDRDQNRRDNAASDVKTGDAVRDQKGKDGKTIGDLRDRADARKNAREGLTERDSKLIADRPARLKLPPVQRADQAISDATKGPAGRTSGESGSQKDGPSTRPDRTGRVRDSVTADGSRKDARNNVDAPKNPAADVNRADRGKGAVEDRPRAGRNLPPTEPAKRDAGKASPSGDMKKSPGLTPGRSKSLPDRPDLGVPRDGKSATDRIRSGDSPVRPPAGVGNRNESGSKKSETVVPRAGKSATDGIRSGGSPVRPPSGVGNRNESGSRKSETAVPRAGKSATDRIRSGDSPVRKSGDTSGLPDLRNSRPKGTESIRPPRTDNRSSLRTAPGVSPNAGRSLNDAVRSGNSPRNDSIRSAPSARPPRIDTPRSAPRIDNNRNEIRVPRVPETRIRESSPRINNPGRSSTPSPRVESRIQAPRVESRSQPRPGIDRAPRGDSGSRAGAGASRNSDGAPRGEGRRGRGKD
jgi:hypothetical protein